MDFLLDRVWLRNVYFNWNGSVNVDMDWNVHVLLDWVRLFDVNRHLDDFLDWYWNMLDN